MWADNETETDLLGFRVHKDLIRQLVTNDDLLPLTIGVFGDWGGGKSSILRMLRRDLEQEAKYPDVACLYFSGWTFEGYDDAKAALISSVLLQLGEHKRFGPKVRHLVVPLLKRVDLMRVLPLVLKRGAVSLAGLALGAGASYFGIDPQAAIASVPFVAAAGSAISSQATSARDEVGGDAGADTAEERERGREEAIDWSKLLAKDRTNPSVLDVRTFRRDFERLLAETDLRALVVLIDDLDRCMPERLIENLEAIRLFLAVPKTAFVIAADERIVRHAVSIRYAAPRLRDEQPADQEPYDLVTDYVEKLIQIPYHLPRLSPSEVETYATLLFCQLHLKEGEKFEKVRAHCEAARERNLYVTYGAGMVNEALAGAIPEELGQRLRWTAAVAPAFTEGLKGNPRQVKRFLNALMLRKQFADVAGLSIRDDVLVKLMLLEYARKPLFDQLYVWQAKADGRPPELKVLEEWAEQAAAPQDGAAVPSGAPSISGGIAPQWAERTAVDWLRLGPLLRDVDLRDYFWIARDKLKMAVTSLTMVSPFVRRLFEGLISANPGERQAAATSTAELDQHELGELLHLLSQQVQRQTDGRVGVDGLLALIERGISGAADALLGALASLPASDIEPSIAFELQTLIVERRMDQAGGRQVLERWSGTHTRIGAAAKSALADLDQPAGGKS